MGIAKLETMTDPKSPQLKNFQIIGERKDKRRESVKRVLPEWLSHPTAISADIFGDKCRVSWFEGLDPLLKETLKANKVKYLFPVQRHIIPYLLQSNDVCTFERPRDICISAPTGSGKTLAYALPIIQILKTRVVCKVRALVILPVRELAEQVYKVFVEYTKGTDLKVGLAAGKKTLLLEQQCLVNKSSLYGYSSNVDIVVATPGRLIDHLSETEGFSLSELRFLVLDEADRLMSENDQGWMDLVEKSVYKSTNTLNCQCTEDTTAFSRFKPATLNPCSYSHISYPCQKLLCSATFSHNPTILQKVSLFAPKLFTSILDPADLPTIDNLANNTKTPQGSYIGRFTVPKELSEFLSVCDRDMKPLLIWYLMTVKGFRRTLCFTNSVTNTHNLFLLLKEMGNVKAEEFSSRLGSSQRSRVIKSFENEQVDILVCSDAMARGMDIQNVEHVLCYDSPKLVETYIHRIGRTARAGKPGTAINFLASNEANRFKRMMKSCRKVVLPEYKFEHQEIDEYQSQYKEALAKVADQVKREIQTLKSQQNPHSKKRPPPKTIIDTDQNVKKLHVE